MMPDNIKSLPNLSNILPSFYLNMLKSWYEANNTLSSNTPIINLRNIRQQMLWGNKNIKFKGKCLVYPNWIKDGIIFINDIIDQKGHISQKLILEKLTSKTNWISELLKLKNCIPKEWVSTLKSDKSLKTSIKTKLNLSLTVNKKSKLIENMSSKDIYNNLNIKNDERPIRFSKWKNIFNLESITPINNVLQFTFTYLINNKNKMLRWKLLHYFLPCKQLLLQWHIQETSMCDLCNLTDDYEHFFLKCQFFHEFWKKIYVLVSKIKIGSHIFNFKTLVLGYKIHDPMYNDINLFLTVLIYSAHISNYKQKGIDAYAVFRNEFLNTYEINKYINAKNSKFLNDVKRYI